MKTSFTRDSQGIDPSGVAMPLASVIYGKVVTAPAAKPQHTDGRCGMERQTMVARPPCFVDGG